MTPRRILVLFGLVAGLAGTITIGILLGRALSGSSEAALPDVRPPVVVGADGHEVDTAARAEAHAGRLTGADLRGESRATIPILEPVVVAGGIDAGDALLDPPPAEEATPPIGRPGLPGSSPSNGVLPVYGPLPASDPADGGDPAGGAAPAPDGDDPDPAPASDLPFFFVDPHLDWSEIIGLPHIDACAGPAPGHPVPETCPPGVAGTFGYTWTEPPAPFMFFSWGHRLASSVPGSRPCPATTPPPGPDEGPMTLSTRTPLAEVHLRYRTYQSTEVWIDLDVEPLPSDDERAWWDDQAARDDFDPAVSALQLCFNVPRHATAAYEIEATGVDVFGQEVRSNTRGLVLPVDATQRPTTKALQVGSAAVVEAYSRDEGHVRLRTRVVGEDESGDDLSCRGSLTPFPQEQVRASAGSPPLPRSVYDPDYTRKHIARVPIPQGGRVLVCADVFPGANPLRPEVTDVLLVIAPRQQRPRLVLQGIRRLGGATLPAGISVTVGTTADPSTRAPCASSYTTPEIPPGPALSVERTVYECVDEALPLDAAGEMAIPVTVTRPGSDGSGSRRTTQVAIPVDLDNCLVGACERPREWYEVFIPSARPECVAGSSGCDESTQWDGIAVMRLEYPVVGTGGGDGRGEVVQLDHVAPAEAEGNLWVTGTTVTPDRPDELYPVTQLEFFTDRPVRGRLRFENVDGACSRPITTDLDDTVLQDSFTVTVEGVCAGSFSMAYLDATEEDGTSHEDVVVGPVILDPLKNQTRVQVEFLGGEGVPDVGWIYAFGVRLDGQTSTAYWHDWSGPRVDPRNQCIPLQGSRAVSRGTYPDVYLRGDELDVEVTITITTTGTGDCSGDPRTGLGTIELTGSFTADQLQSGEPMVLESAPDSALPMRVTVTTARPRWRS